MITRNSSVMAALVKWANAAPAAPPTAPPPPAGGQQAPPPAKPKEQLARRQVPQQSQYNTAKGLPGSTPTPDMTGQSSGQIVNNVIAAKGRLDSMMNGMFGNKGQA